MASAADDYGNNENGRKAFIDRLSVYFENLSGWSYDHRWIVLALCIFMLVLCGFAAYKVRFDNSFEAYFDRGDRIYQDFLQFRDDFGSDEMAYILYEAPEYEYGPWNIEVMDKIRRLTRELEEEVPFIKKVTSLSNVEFIEGVPGELLIYDLLNEFPESQEALLNLKAKFMTKPMYLDNLVSRDSRYAAILIDMEKAGIDPVEEIRLDPEKGDALDNLYPQVTNARIEEILARPQYKGISFYHTGDVALNATYNTMTKSESSRLGWITMTAIALLFLFFFRNALGVFGPLVVVFLSILVSAGFMGCLGWDMDLMFIMLPSILIAVGVADSVHYLSEFRYFHVKMGDRKAAIRKTSYLVGLPCLFTSLTTLAGFSSMGVSPIKAIRHFAAYSAVGVAGAFLLTVTLLIVMLSFGKRHHAKEMDERDLLRAKGGAGINRILQAISRFNIRFRKTILAVSAALLIVTGIGIFRLEVDTNFMNEFSDKVPIKKTTLFVDSVMGGAGGFTYIFDTGEPDGILDPKVLKEIEAFQNEAIRHSNLVMKTMSIIDLLKDINKTFHDEDPAYYVIPDTREMVAQYLLLYEMSGGEELHEYISADYSRANLQIRCKLVGTKHYKKLVNDLNAFLESHAEWSVKPRSTGMGALWVKLIDYIVKSQIEGFLLAFTVIAVMMCILFSSVRIGLLAMVPNLIPVVITLGVMGWSGVTLDYIKLLIACVAIGIAVDDTIHLTARFHHEFRRFGTYREALGASMSDVGRALFITTVVLVTGFMVLTFSWMVSIQMFGILVATTILVALLADFFLMPALVLTFKPFGPEHKNGVGNPTGSP